MCCAEFIAKYILIIANLLFSLVGIVIIALGVTVLVNLRDLQEIFPVNVLYIGLIVLGVAVFFIGFLACCGAIKESRCMLIFYAVVVGIILAVCIYLTSVVFRYMESLQDLVDGWIVDAFNAQNLRSVFNLMESTFRCCGTTGANSYTVAGEALPASCCASTAETCVAAIARQGCGSMVGDWFEIFASAIGGVLVVVILVEAVAVVVALFVSHSIKNKMRRNAY